MLHAVSRDQSLLSKEQSLLIENCTTVPDRRKTKTKAKIYHNAAKAQNEKTATKNSDKKQHEKHKKPHLK